MRSVILSLVCFGCFAVPAQALANLDPAGYTVAHQPQIGSCGNVWAKATVTRTWQLHRSSGSRDVWKIYYGGNFTTQAGPSPGACDAVGGVGVLAGLHGKIGGYTTVRVQHPGGRTFNPLGICQGGCSAVEFVAAFYPPGTTWIEDGPGTAARFHFRPDSPWLPLLCMAEADVNWDYPDWVPGSAISGDIATTC